MELQELSIEKCYQKLKPQLTHRLEKANTEKLNSITYELSDSYTLGRLASPVLTPKCLGCQPMEFEVLEMLAEDGKVKCHTCMETCQLTDLLRVTLFEEILAGDPKEQYNQVILYLKSHTYAYIANATLNSFPHFREFEIALRTAKGYASNAEPRSVRSTLSKEEKKRGYIELLIAEKGVSQHFIRGRKCEHASVMDFKYYYENLFEKSVVECPFCSLRLEIVELEFIEDIKLTKVQYDDSEPGKIKISTKEFGLVEHKEPEEVMKILKRIAEESTDIQERQKDLAPIFYFYKEIAETKISLPIKVRNDSMYLAHDPKFQELLRDHIK